MFDCPMRYKHTRILSLGVCKRGVIEDKPEVRETYEYILRENLLSYFSFHSLGSFQSIRDLRLLSASCSLRFDLFVSSASHSTPWTTHFYSLLIYNIINFSLPRKSRDDNARNCWKRFSMSRSIHLYRSKSNLPSLIHFREYIKYLFLTRTNEDSRYLLDIKPVFFFFLNSILLFVSLWKIYKTIKPFRTQFYSQNGNILAR